MSTATVGQDIPAGSGDTLIVVFGDGDPLSHFIMRTAHPASCHIIRVSRRPVQDDSEVIELVMSERTRSQRRLAVLGFAAAGWSAVRSGLALSADVVLAIALERGQQGLQERVEKLDSASTAHSPAVHILWGADGVSDTERGIMNEIAAASSAYRADLPGVMLPAALHWSGRLQQILAALAGNRELPDLTTLKTEWRKRFDYALEFDDDAVIEDPAGRRRLRGRVRNLGSCPIETEPDGILIGARICNGGGTSLDREPRSRLARPVLNAGETSAFSIGLPPLDPDELDASIEVGLLSEGQFWFDAAGYPIATLRFDADASPTSSVPQRLPSADTAVPPAPPPTVNAESVVPMSERSALDKYKQMRAGTDAQATLDDLWHCYRLFLLREPDPQGFESYAAVVQRGAQLDELARMFLSSPEFARRIEAPSNAAIARVDLEGFSLYVPKADAVVGEELQRAHEYEPHVAVAMREALHKCRTFVDVGANIGYFTALAARQIGPDGRVIAIEPLPRNVRLLLANVLLNNFTNVRVLPFGASDKEGCITLMAIGSIASSRGLRAEDLTQVNALEFAYADTLDHIVGDAPVDVLKIDIDGFDHKALLGARGLLEAHHPQIFAEFAPALLREHSGIPPIQYLKYLIDCGYNDLSVLSRSAAPQSFGQEIERLARLPEETGATHVDILARRL